jgi:ribosomal protein L16/L10AE
LGKGKGRPQILAIFLEKFQKMYYIALDKREDIYRKWQ